MFVRGDSTVYTREQLLSLRSRSSLLPEITVDRVRSLSLRRSRGVRAGRNKPRPIRMNCTKSSDRRPQGFQVATSACSVTRSLKLRHVDCGQYLDG